MRHPQLIFTLFALSDLAIYKIKIIYNNVKSYKENETFLKVFLNISNRDALVHYPWMLTLEIIDHTKIIIKC